MSKLRPLWSTTRGPAAPEDAEATRRRHESRAQADRYVDNDAANHACGDPYGETTVWVDQRQGKGWELVKRVTHAPASRGTPASEPLGTAPADRTHELEPTPELIATARGVASRQWTVANNQSAFEDMDPNLRALVDAGYVVLYLPPTRLRDDYWTLTAAGRAWLVEHTRETED